MCWRLRKCCFCLPLRIGLLVWAFFALGSLYISIVIYLCIIQNALDDTWKVLPSEYVENSMIIVALFAHFVFHIVLLGGLYKKGRGLLEVYYGYCVLAAITETVLVSFFLPVSVYKMVQRETRCFYVTKYLITMLLFTGISLTIQIHIIVAVRSFISTITDDKEDSLSQHLAVDEDYVELQGYKTEEC